ncbi:MAG TPA: ABC transporter ATP-binding protein [Cyclobacteriaceae bacterium]|nr:ABC transporter ATP-binding protein [Cyclobacteriaceae bacterium]
MTPVFQTKKLTVGYRNGTGELRLFEDLDLQLVPGELICFMGPNGSGKSTLIRTLAGLQQPLSGTLPPKDEKQVAVVLTDRIQSQHMVVRELIAYGRYPYLGWDLSLSQIDKDKIGSAIDLVRIGSMLDKKINELSDGQMQMVMIARALVQDTSILLLDEPTAHLDLNNRLEIMNLLRKLAREKNKSILLATHELDLALQTADKVWLASGKELKKGIPEDLVLDGSFDEVFQFKGYDLKTGKVQHEAFRKRSVTLKGEGPVLLWTKNALERNGYSVDENSATIITIGDGDWSIENRIFRNLKGLINSLNTEHRTPNTE